MIISRFHNQKKLELDCSFLSPCFLGSATQEAELRSPPFKHLFRFWWRALYGPEYEKKEMLKETEMALFGDTSSSSLLRIAVSGNEELVLNKRGFPNGKKVKVSSGSRTFDINILDYLAYGPCEYVKGSGNEYTRPWLKENSTFKLTCTYPDIVLKVKETQYIKVGEQVETVLEAIKRFGALGAKSRNGFGALSLISGTDKRPSIPNFSNRPPDKYPAFSKKSCLFITKETYDSWEETLSELGIAYRTARSALENKHNFERRGYIARPIIAQNASDEIKNERFPKHFFLGLSKEGDKYRGHILSLPIIFYNEKEQGDYNRVIDDMHKNFSQTLQTKTIWNGGQNT